MAKTGCQHRYHILVLREIHEVHFRLDPTNKDLLKGEEDDDFEPYFDSSITIRCENSNCQETIEFYPAWEHAPTALQNLRHTAADSYLNEEEEEGE